MNEELLRSLHNSLGGDKAGSYQSFVEEFNKSDELRQTLWNKLGGEQAGTFESFLSEVGFSTPKPPEEKKPTSAAEYFGNMFADPKTTTQSSFKQQDQETLGMPTFLKMFPGKREGINKERKEDVTKKLKEHSSIFYENNKLLNDPNTSELDRKAAVLKSLNASRVLSSEASSALKEIHGIDLADVDKLAYKAETLERKLAEINRLPLSKEERELRSSEVSSQLSETNKQLDEFTKYVGSLPEYQYLQESINSRKQLMEIADANFPELKKTREETEQEQKESDEIAKSSELSDEFKTVGRWIGGKILGTAHNLQKSGLGAQRILARALLSGDAEKTALINTFLKEEELEGVAQALSPSSIQGRFNEEFVKTKDGTKVVFENGEPAFGRDKDGYKIELTEEQIKEANEKSGEGLEKDYNYGMLLNNFSQVAFDMIPTILVTRGLGTGSKLASALTVGSTTAAQSFGGYYFDALKNGASEDKAIGLALSKSILDGALENIGGLEARLSKIGMEESTLRLIKEDVIDGLRKGSIAQKDVLKYYASRVKETVTGGLKQGAGETIEEFSESLEQGLMDMFVMNDRKTLEEIPKDALETFLISMGLGTGTSFLQEASAFKKNTSNDLMYNSILMAINNPDKAAQVAKDMELSDTSFIDVLRDDIESLGIKDDQKKLEALRLLSQRYALENKSGKEKSGSVAAKVRSKKIKEIEAELNTLGENKIYEPSEEEAQDMDNRPEIEKSDLLEVLNKAVTKTEVKKEEQKPAVQSSIEFPSVESLEDDLEFNDFDPKQEFSFEKEESPVDTPQTTAQEDISDTDYQTFIDTGNVKDEVLTSIATKVESGNTELTDRETVIFTANTDKLNKILQDQIQEEVKDTQIEQTDSRVFKVGNKNFNIVPTSNSEMGGEISVDDKTYKAWKKRDDQEKKDADLIKKSNWSKEVKEKQLKANALSSAADKRRILGTRTVSENKNIAKKEAGIQIGDKATVGGITYGVLGHTFGRIKVRTNEGNEFTVTKDSEVAKALKDQKKKTSTEPKGEIVQNKEEFLKSKGSDKLQQKTDGGKETNLQQRIEKVKSALKALVPNLKVKIHNTPEEYKQDYEKRHPNMDEEGKSMLKRSIASFDDSTNTIHLNLQRLKSSSLFHEGTHPLIDILETLNPGYTEVLFDELVEIEKELGIEGEYTKKFASQYPDAQKKNEAVVQFIAKVADGTIDLDDKNVFFKVKKFLSNIWDRILRALGKEVKDNINTKEDLKNLAKTISEAFNTGKSLYVDEVVADDKTDLRLGLNGEVYQIAGKESYDKESFIPKDKAYQATQPFTNYTQALLNHDNVPQRNIYVRRLTNEDNSKRVLAVQPSSKYIIDRMRDSNQSSQAKVFDEYFDNLYSTVPGYDRSIDFMEVPFWIAEASGSIGNDLDMYVLRDPDEFSNFIQQAGYGKVMLSVLDANFEIVKKIVKDNPNTQFFLGGYVQGLSSKMKEFPNAHVFSTMQSGVDAAGYEYNKKYDYSLFNGMEVVPRLKMSDGCLYKCAFCTVEKKITTMSQKTIDEQVASLKDLNMKYVYLDDKTFGQADNYEYIIEAGNQLAASVPNFEGFIIQTTSATVKKMEQKDPDFFKKARIKIVEIGIESNNDSVLRGLRKPNSEKLNAEAVKILRKHGLKFVPNLIIGFENETEQTYENTIKFLEENSDIISHANIYNLAVYEGTELDDKMNARLEADRNENVLEKSFHSDPALHERYYYRIYDVVNSIMEKNNSKNTERFQLEDDSKEKAIDNIKNYFTRKNIPKTPDKIDKFYSKFESDLESAGITKDDISRSFNPPPGVDDTAGTTTGIETPEAVPTGVDPQAVDEKFIEGVAKDVQNVQDSDLENLVSKYHANNEKLAEALNPDLEGLTEKQRTEAIDEKKYLVTTHERMLSSMDKFFSLLKGRFQDSYLEKSYELFNSIATKDSLNAAVFGIRLKELIETRLKDPSLSTDEAISLRLLRKKLTRDLQVKGKQIARVLSLYRRIKNNANTIRTNVIANTPGAKKRAEEIESELEKAEDIDENEGFKSTKPSKDSDAKPKTKKVPAMDALAKAKAKIKGVSDSKTIGAKFRELTNKRPC